MIYDKEMAERFIAFRKKYVAKTQKAAALKLNIQQSKISRMETAIVDLGLSDIYPLIKDYSLNVEWLTTGRGTMKIVNPAKSTLVTDMSKLHADMEVLMKGLKILQINQSFIANNLEKRIEHLEAKMGKIEQLV